MSFTATQPADEDTMEASFVGETQLVERYAAQAISPFKGNIPASVEWYEGYQESPLRIGWSFPSAQERLSRLQNIYQKTDVEGELIAISDSVADLATAETYYLLFRVATGLQVYIYSPTDREPGEKPLTIIDRLEKTGNVIPYNWTPECNNAAFKVDSRGMVYGLQHNADNTYTFVTTRQNRAVLSAHVFSQTDAHFQALFASGKFHFLPMFVQPKTYRDSISSDVQTLFGVFGRKTTQNTNQLVIVQFRNSNNRLAIHEQHVIDSPADADILDAVCLSENADRVVLLLFKDGEMVWQIKDLNPNRSRIYLDPDQDAQYVTNEEMLTAESSDYIPIKDIRRRLPHLEPVAFMSDGSVVLRVVKPTPAMAGSGATVLFMWSLVRYDSVNNRNVIEPPTVLIMDKKPTPEWTTKSGLRVWQNVVTGERMFDRVGVIDSLFLDPPPNQHAVCMAGYFILTSMAGTEMGSAHKNHLTEFCFNPYL
jgi:hypothetical protein